MIWVGKWVIEHHVAMGQAPSHPKARGRWMSKQLDYSGYRALTHSYVSKRTQLTHHYQPLCTASDNQIIIDHCEPCVQHYRPCNNAIWKQWCIQPCLYLVPSVSPLKDIQSYPSFLISPSPTLVGGYNPSPAICLIPKYIIFCPQLRFNIFFWNQIIILLMSVQPQTPQSTLNPLLDCFPLPRSLSNVGCSGGFRTACPSGAAKGLSQATFQSIYAMWRVSRVVDSYILSEKQPRKANNQIITKDYEVTKQPRRANNLSDHSGYAGGGLALPQWTTWEPTQQLGWNHLVPLIHRGFHPPGGAQAEAVSIRFANVRGQR